MAANSGKEGVASFRVTVDRNGDVLSADLMKKSRSSLLNSAAKRVVKRADFPSLPSDYKGEKLTFALKLKYALAYSAKEQKLLQREGRVSSRRIASNTGPVSASIEILDAE